MSLGSRLILDPACIERAGNERCAIHTDYVYCIYIIIDLGHYQRTIAMSSKVLACAENHWIIIAHARWIVSATTQTLTLFSREKAVIFSGHRYCRRLTVSRSTRSVPVANSQKDCNLSSLRERFERNLFHY